jgi:hypothetical protein
MRLLAETSPLADLLSLALWILGLIIVGTSIWLKIVCKQDIWSWLLKLLGAIALVALVSLIVFYVTALVSA